MLKDKPIVIGVSGFARSGKDTFVRIASKILRENGYTTETKSFAAGLKNDLDSWLIDKYGISAWTDDEEEKKLIRPFLVAHGCGKRLQTQGKYWIDKIDQSIFQECVSKLTFAKPDSISNHVFFVSDVRFPNEADWLQKNWNGWLVHLKKYSLIMPKGGISIYNEIEQLENPPWKHFDSAPNEEEATNDPFCEQKSDYKLELENAIEKELRETGNKITAESLIDNTYLLTEIKLCLTKCPFLTIK